MPNASSYSTSMGQILSTANLAIVQYEACIIDASRDAWKHLQKSEIIRQGDISLRFKSLLWDWKVATKFISSDSDRILHPAYQQMIGLGAPAIPLMLRELMREEAFLFPALRAIAGVNPVQEDHRGDVPAMTQDWLEWGRQHNYL